MKAVIIHASVLDAGVLRHGKIYHQDMLGHALNNARWTVLRLKAGGTIYCEVVAKEV